jgi:hypothetical protein
MAVCLALAVMSTAPNGGMAQAPEGNSAAPTQTQDRAARFPGMDQSVNVDLAAKAGTPARKPYINVEEWGDLWNLILLLGGGVCGFVIGRSWDHIWGKSR